MRLENGIINPRSEVALRHALGLTKRRRAIPARYRDFSGAAAV